MTIARLGARPATEQQLDFLVTQQRCDRRGADLGLGIGDIDLLIDLNFNAKTEGYLKILKAIADFDMGEVLSLLGKGLGCTLA